MPTSDIILVSEMPQYRIPKDDRSQFEFVPTSGDRKRVFRIPKHRAKNAVMAAWKLLREDDEAPSNISPIEPRKHG